ncbi:MAG: lamin tail domain-containing protein [Verrucomicrobiales bacterium]
MKTAPLKFLTVLTLAIAAPVTYAVPVISEFLADNDLGLRDEDGDDEDWIEIHNPDTSAINLAGWRLTDDSLDLAKWTFPSRVLAPNGRLVVFASNKNRKPATGNLHTNFRLDQDGDFLSLISPSGTPSTTFSPVYHFQTKNRSFGTGFAGTVATTDATPAAFIAGTHYNRVKLSGIGSAQFDGSLNSFDDSAPQQGHQQYLWYDYSSRLGAVPAGQTVVEATLEWSGTARIFAGVSGLSTVAGSVGVFPAPDAAKGVTTIATGADGDDLVDFYSSHSPVSTVGHEPGQTQSFVWDVTALVRQWIANPADPTRGQFILVTSSQPVWIAWDQNRPGPKLTVRTVNSPTPVSAVGFMSPTPGADNTGVTAAGPLVRGVTQNPAAPPVGGSLVVSARILPAQGGAVSTVTLGHRKMYEAEQPVPMTDDGLNGDVLAGDGVFSASISGAAIEAGKMLRWKVTATDAAGYQTKIPPFRDPLDAPEYFGTVPVDPSVTTNLPLLEWFIQNPSAANTTSGTRCSIAFKGEFYDNVGINIHGQSTQGGTFPKKSYDIDGNRGYRFKWSDDPAEIRAKDINLLTVFGDKTKARHCLAYEMNIEAGVPAHYCFPVRVQQNGLFFGLLDFVEDADDVYLERAGLNKDGALYKMYNNMTDAATHAVAGAEKKNRKEENNTDLQAFLNGLTLTDATARKNFLYDHVDLPKMVNFMAANTATANIDLHSKNYYIYRDTGKTNLWTLLPWDLDLSFGRLWTAANNYFDDGIYINAGGFRSGTGQNLVSKLWAIAEFDVMVRRRIRTLHEQFWKQSAVSPDPTRWVDRRFQEMLALVGDDAALDHAKYTPGPWHNPAPAVTESPFRHNTMSQEISRLFSNFIVQRVNAMYGDALMPPTQNVDALQPLVFSQIDVSPASGNQNEEFVRIQNPNSVAIDISGWRLAEAIDFTFEPGTVLPASGSIYVSPDVVAFKARATAPRGGQGLVVVGEYSGRLSNLGETVRLLDAAGTQRAITTYPGAPTVWQESLVITEIMYNPGGDGLAEYLELMNIGDAALPLADVRFTQGIEFDFTGSTVTSLAPGSRVLLVRSLAAFQAVHGTGHSVAGEFAAGSALDNGGEGIKLEDPENNTIKEFNYDDVPPWPMLPDGGGYSLVLIHPASNPDPAIPANWRSSVAINGSPGGGDSTAFSGDPLADLDGDGLSALLEYALGSDAASVTAFNHLTTGTESSGHLDVDIVHALAADDVALHLEWSQSLGSWSEPPAELVAELRLPGGLTRQTWRLTLSNPTALRHFLRLRAVLR